jgi:hypothetical protein
MSPTELREMVMLVLMLGTVALAFAPPSLVLGLARFYAWLGIFPRSGLKTLEERLHRK